MGFAGGPDFVVTVPAERAWDPSAYAGKPPREPGAPQQPPSIAAAIAGTVLVIAVIVGAVVVIGSIVAGAVGAVVGGVAASVTILSLAVWAVVSTKRT